MRSQATVVAGGTVVTAAGSRRADVVIEHGRVTRLTPTFRGAVDRVIDASGAYVLPGGVDPHSHLLPHIVADTRAAVLGGTTSAISFTLAGEGESPGDAYRRAESELAPTALIDVRFHPRINRPDQLGLRDLQELKRLGARSIKLFLAYSELGMMASDRTLFETLRDASRLGLLVQVHCENGGAIEALTAQLLAAGDHGAEHFGRARPAGVEAEAVARTLALADLAGAPVYLVHLSTAASLDHVRAARARGVCVYAEVCLHHLLFDDTTARDGDVRPFLNVPPMRAASDVEALWDAIADGTVDTVGSDHSHGPYHPPPAGDFTGLPYGYASVGTRVPLFLSAALERDLPLERIVDLLATSPARVFGWYPAKGEVAVGGDADLLVWDPDERWTIGPASFGADVPHAPFEGLTVDGSLRAVLRRGAPLVRDGELQETGVHVAGRA
jgi:dihydropyrimidinase